MASCQKYHKFLPFCYVLTVYLKNIFLSQNYFSNIVRFRKCFDSIRHASDKDIEIEKAKQSLMDIGMNRNFSSKSSAGNAKCFLSHAARPSKLLEIHRKHLPDCLVANGAGHDLFGSDAQERTGLDIVKAAIFHEKFDSCPRFRAFLDFIEKNERTPWFKGGSALPDAPRRDVLDDSVCVPARAESSAQGRIFDEIQLGKAVVLLLAKLADERGFAHLTGPSDKHRVPARTVLPFQQGLVETPLEHGSSKLSFVRRAGPVRFHSGGHWPGEREQARPSAFVAETAPDEAGKRAADSPMQTSPSADSERASWPDEAG